MNKTDLCFFCFCFCFFLSPDTVTAYVKKVVLYLILYLCNPDPSFRHWFWGSGQWLLMSGPVGLVMVEESPDLGPRTTALSATPQLRTAPRGLRSSILLYRSSGSNIFVLVKLYVRIQNPSTPLWSCNHR